MPTLTYPQKQLFSLVSGFLIHTVFGAMYTLGTITPYIASNLHYQTDPSIRVVDVSINYPIMMVAETLGLVLTMIFFRAKFRGIMGERILCWVGVWGFGVSVILASFMDTLWAFTIFYGGFFGFFVGVAYMSPFKNTYSYFPHRKGMCGGICMMGYGIGSFIYNQIFLHLVNPNNMKPDQQHIFPEEVARNFPGALRVLAVVYLSIGTLGCLLFIPNQRPIDGQAKPITTQSVLTEPHNSKQQPTQQTPLKAIQLYFTISPEQKSTHILIPIEKQLLQIWLTIYTSSLYGVFIAYNYKQYGEIILDDDSLITLAGSLGCVSNSLGRIFWCIVFDWVGFKAIMGVLDLCLLGCCTACIFVRNQNVYIVLVILTYFFAGSFYGLMPTQTVRTFGSEIGTKVYPFIFSGFALASISQFIIHSVVIRKWGDSGFQAAFIGFAVVQVVSIGLVMGFRYTRPDGIGILRGDRVDGGNGERDGDYVEQK